MRWFAVAILVCVACGGGGGEAKDPSSTKADSSVTHSDAAGEGSAGAPAKGTPTAVDCGDYTTCALTTEGEVRCWGRDKHGELGDGGGANKPKHIGVDLGGKATQIMLASQFGCALLESKKVKCWGTGHIANDGKTYTNAKATDVAGVSGAEELAASGAVACARTGDGVVCWGGDPATNSTPPKGAFTQIAAGFSHACALDAKGAVTCWGSGDWGGKGAYAKPALGTVTQVVAGDRHACALTKDGKVKCWGSNDAGQLGAKSDTNVHAKAVDVSGVTGAKRLVVGEASTCAVLASGGIKCWGANNEGELGLGSRTPEERPSAVSALSDVSSMCLGSVHGCALGGGRIVCWGGDSDAQLGDASKERRPSPTPLTW